MKSVIKVPLTNKTCPLGEEYAMKHLTKPPKIAVLSCEGACLRGEIARRAANFLTRKMPDMTVRVCSGGLLETRGGMKSLVEKATKVFNIEGCYLACSSRITRAAVPNAKTKVIVGDRLYEFNRELFTVDDMPDDEINKHAAELAERVIDFYLDSS